MSFDPPRGMRDFFPDEMRIRNWMFDTWRECAEIAAFEQYDAPVVENRELFIRKAGEEVVDQIYLMEDKSGRELALRPELTPSLARMISSKGKALALPAKWFGLAQCFRYERMVRGRKREHYQWNLDIIGQKDVTAEAEVISTALSSIKAFGLGSDVVKLRVGSRKLVSELLEKLGFNMDQFMSACMVLDKRDKIGDDAIRNLLVEGGVKESDIQSLFKILDIKDFKDAQKIVGDDSEALNELVRLFDLLEIAGYADFLTFDVAVIRGLAYYTGIVWEAFDVKGRHRAIFGGGRYDDLLSSLGGDSQPCVGLGFGDVVIYELLKDENLLPDSSKKVDLYVGYMDQSSEKLAMQAASLCRAQGVKVELSLEPQKPKKIFTNANKSGSHFVFIIGLDEAAKKSGTLKNLELSSQELVSIEELATKVIK